MSTHPNVILMAVLTPDNLTRKTARDILANSILAIPNETDVKVGNTKYYMLIMESDYNEGMQIGAHEGDIVFHKHVTYDYGESILWSDLEKLKLELETWATEKSKLFNCTYEIRIGANYW